MKPKIPKEIARFLPTAEALSLLLHPYAEVVVHDLKTKKIAALFNNFSKRKPGDPSLLEDDIDPKTLPDYFGPYPKTNFNGRALKSMSSAIRNDVGDAVGLLCVNFDITDLQNTERALALFTRSAPAGDQPTELFTDDWKERINHYVADYLKEEQLNFQSLDRDGKQKLVKKLKSQGAFKAKNAAVYVAEILNVSRATVYAYLA